jgi:2-polyprenyl-6-methoxyphenol hydroxylase-like FAD-dependent oxidoreductase
MKAEASRLKAIIIGGGIGGLTAAIALRRKGIDAVVYERAPQMQVVGAGISLWPNAVKALRVLGLGEALDQVSLMNETGALRRANGSILAITSAKAMETRFGGGVIVLHRAELQDLLRSFAGPETVRLGHALVGIEQDDRGVTARFENGMEARGDVLIGADGLHSVVRRCLDHTDPLRYSGYTAWRGVVAFDHTRVVAGETIGCGKRFGILPISGGRLYWFATTNAPEREAEPAEGRKAQLLDLFRGWHSPIEDIVRATGERAILRNDIYDREPVAAWGRGRVTLLGDAAHPMTPNLGQGGCQAIEDALELAARLADRPSTGLRDYEARRIPRTRMIVQASRRWGQMGQMTNAASCGIRDLALRLTPLSVTLGSLAGIAGYEGHLDGWRPGIAQRAMA